MLIVHLCHILILFFSIMPQFCAIVKCGSRSGRDKVSFHRFPSIFDNRKNINPLAEKRRELWIKATRRADLTTEKLKWATVCSKHFVGGKPSALKDVDNIDWVPNQSLGYKKNINANQSIQRLNCRKQRDKNERPNPNIQVDMDRIEDRIDNDPLCEALNNPAVQNLNIIDEEDISEPVEEVEHAQNSGEHQCPDINFELQNCYSEIHHLRETLQTYTFTMESLEQNPSKCLFYTGLPYEKVVVIYNFVEPYITHPKCVLSKFQLFIIFVTKLRLNFLFTDIGHRFNVDRRTISRVFYKVLHVMYVRLKFCIVWPERDTLKKNIPRCFKEYFGGKVTIIIDCFEIFTETPKNKQAASQHFSSYKHHNTIKFLIGISPQGSIMFISEAFAGRCSDKFVTENCGILDLLLPGDCILADRGFLIQDEVKLHLAEVIIPTFMKNKKQLNPIEVEETRRLANVRIHVERVIGSIRNKYKITSSTLPMHMIKFKQNNVPVIDKILTVCCALINLCPSIVPY